MLMEIGAEFDEPMDSTERRSGNKEYASRCSKERLTLPIQKSNADPESTTDRHEFVSFK